MKNIKTPRLLDLFCGAGGAATGYSRAGFEVVGVDIKPQKHFPFEFCCADAMTYPLDGFDVIHASPPCQGYSVASVSHRKAGKCYPLLINDVRKRLKDSGKPFVIENVERAPLIAPVKLCGTMFNLGVFRHRLFESNIFMLSPGSCLHDQKIGEGKYFSVAGGAGRWKSWGKVYRNISKGSADQWKVAMGIDWMTRNEIKDAIPPAYTEFIGKQILNYILS